MAARSPKRTRPRILIAALVGVLLLAGSAALAITASDPTQDVPRRSAPAERGAPVELPGNVEAIVDVEKLEFLAGGLDGVRVWAGPSRDGELECYVTSGASSGVTLSGVDCDTRDAYEQRGITVSGGTSPEGRFTGFAILASDLDAASADGQVLEVEAGIAFFNLEPGARTLRASGADRNEELDISSSTAPLG